MLSQRRCSMSSVCYPAIHRVFACVLIVGLAACSSQPSWVKTGSTEFHQDDETAFYGVGAVAGVKNAPLAWEVAENRARAELARHLETYTAYLMRDYAAATGTGSIEKVTEEQDIERAIKTFTARTLHGVRPVDRYYNEDETSYYVLVKLPFEQVKTELERDPTLPSGLRSHIKQHAEEAFKRLEQEEAEREQEE
ncbi:MAG: hypothetical protein D6690_05210 [Nitrospirae bacterium]|nr:MAG: hypothetical protein D6690_05210 [Nitrospirota bacterium]